jgi:hypothetical protein
VAGALTGIVLSLGADAALRAAGVFPAVMTNALFVLATAYRAIYGVAGSYLTARLAPNRPMRHALVLGAIGLAACIAGAVAAWNQPELGPRWYPLALVALAMPQSWAGGRLSERQLEV